jgi:succinyl-diaminopimelate desuccinylase
LEAIRAALPEMSRLKLAVCLEPTDGEIQLGCVGGLQAKVTYTGRRAHSARPWQGENAIHKAGPLLTRLLERSPKKVTQSGLEFAEVLSATLAHGGHARNVVPDRFDLNLNYRFAPGQSLDQAEADLRDWIGAGPAVEIVDRSPSGRVCRDNPLTERMIRMTGAPVASKQAWTDVGRLSSWGIDAVNFGPGETAQAHQANESCDIPRLEGVARQLASFLAGGHDS